ncbi:MAG: CHASE2 domain-containing protein [Armatimonadia bacterium]
MSTIRIPHNARNHRSHQLRHFVLDVCIGTAVGILVVLMVHKGYLATWELVWSDALFSAQTERASSDIKLIAVTADDFARWGGPRLPEYFPRDKLAALIRRVAQMKPAAICVDLLLAERRTADDDQLRAAIAWAASRDVPVIIAHDPRRPDKDSFTPGLAGAVDPTTEGHEVRWLYPQSTAGTTPMKSMSLLACESYRRRRLACGLPVGPPPPEEPMPIRFWPRAQFPSWSPATIPLEWLPNTIVIIGREDAACQDVKYVPVRFPSVPGLEDDQMYGMEVQAECIATLLSHHPPRLGSYGQGVAVEFVVAALASLAVIWLGVVWGNLLSLAAVTLLGGYLSLRFFSTTGYVLNILPTLLAVTLTSIVSRELEERRLRNWLGAMVSRPVAHALGRQLLPEPGAGEIENLVILDFDLRASSQLALEMNPAEFGPAINELLARVCAVVLAHGGIVNKYLGDGLLTFWPAAENLDPQAPQEALATAFAVRDSLADLAPRWRESTGHELHFAVAVHCGPAWLGFVGLPRRLEYTVLGRTVGDCFALQEIAAESGTEIIVSQSLLEAAGSAAATLSGDGRWRQGQRGDLAYQEFFPAPPSVAPSKDSAAKAAP